MEMIGLDLHKRESQLATKEEDGAVTADLARGFFPQRVSGMTASGPWCIRGPDSCKPRAKRPRRVVDVPYRAR